MTDTEELERLRREVERLQALLAGDTKLARLHYEQDVGFDMEFRGAIIGRFAAECRHVLGDAPNYVEMQFEDDLGGLVVTVQKREGATPNQKRLAAEAELSAAREEIAKLRAVERAARDLYHSSPVGTPAEDVLRAIGTVKEPA